MIGFSASMHWEQLQYLPFGQYEYVDVTFQAADTDTVIPYKTLKPATAESVRWIDITPGSVYSAGEAPAVVFRSGNPARIQWAPNYIVLMSSVAGYTTRLLLFTERV